MAAEASATLMAKRDKAEGPSLNAVRRLSPRQRLTLDLLLHGHSRETIADRLEISNHTARGYVKEVFKHFGVHTHAELIAGFYQGKLK